MTTTVCETPSATIVVCTWYSFGVSGDHRMTLVMPVIVSVAVVVPVPVKVTELVADASCVVPSMSEAVTDTGARGTVAASIVTCTCTEGLAVSTFAGSANTSATNTWGTTRSATSRYIPPG